MAAVTRSRTEKPSTVQSVKRAFAVLQALAEARRPCTAREISNVTSIHRTIVHRLLTTLLELDLAIREGSGRYALGSRALTLGYEYLDGLAVRRITLPYVVHLSRDVIKNRPWVVSIGIPVGDEVVVIERVWGPRVPLNSLLDIGTRLPIDRSAAGRSMLAQYDANEAEARLGPSRWRRVKPALGTISRDGGIAVARGEFQPGINALAAPVLDGQGRPAAAIIVSGTDLEDELEFDSELAQHVRRAAREASETLARTVIGT